VLTQPSNSLRCNLVLYSTGWLEHCLGAFVSIQFSRMSPAAMQTMAAKNEEPGDDEQETDASEP